MTAAELRDELMTLLVAGHETTARVALRGFTFVPADGAEVVVEARAA